MTGSSMLATGPVKFLLVDDLEQNLVALEALVRRDGLVCLLARSGQEALELLLENEVALALVDVQMPGMDGYDLAELMRGSPRTREVPIVLVTAGEPGSTTSEWQRRAARKFKGYEAGAVDFLFKPIDERALRNKADTFFNLYRQKQHLRANLELNEMFVAILSHDLRNPLNAVLAGSDLLMNVEDSRVARVAAKVRAASNRMATMIDQLSDLSRMRIGGGILVERRRVDLREVLSRIEGELDLSTDQLPLVRAEGDTWGFWDEVRLGQVVSNLLGNAVRHGRGDVRVRVDGTQRQSVELVVHNAGSIPLEMREALFDPFRKGRRTSSSGLGLGLFICQQIVHAHEGTISVQTGDLQGTTFAVTLPRMPSAA